MTCAVRPHCTGEPAPGSVACSACLANLSVNLRTIADDMALMPVEAVQRGTTTNPAADLAGPVANPIRHRWRQIDADAAGRYAEEPDDDDPYVALTRRERFIREELGHDTDTLCSPDLARCVAYLTWALPDLARREDLALLLADLADVARHLRAHLDAVLHDQQGGERGAPCPECEPPAPRLHKRWATWDPTGDHDEWVCPRDPEHWWRERDYRLRVGAEYRASAGVLTAGDIELEYGVRQGTLRKWAHEGKVAKLGLDGTGRQLYDVAPLKALREAEGVLA